MLNIEIGDIISKHGKEYVSVVEVEVNGRRLTNQISTLRDGLANKINQEVSRVDWSGRITRFFVAMVILGFEVEI